MQKITPFLWFNGNAEEAAIFYTSVFPNAKIDSITRYPEGGPAPAGSVLTVAFSINGQQFVGLNGGPEFPFTEAVSFVVNCESQEEVDASWEQLLEGGTPSHCGWLKDRFGLSWQVVPTGLVKMLQDKDPEKTKRVMAAMMGMTKIDLNVLEEAYAAEGETV